MRVPPWTEFSLIGVMAPGFIRRPVVLSIIASSVRGEPVYRVRDHPQ